MIPFRDLAKGNEPLPEFVLFDMRTKHEYEANAFASHLIIDDDELDQHQVDVCSHCSRELHHIVVLLHQVNQLIIVNDQVRGKRIRLIFVFCAHSDFLKNVRPEGRMRMKDSN